MDPKRPRQGRFWLILGAAGLARRLRQLLAKRPPAWNITRVTDDLSIDGGVGKPTPTVTLEPVANRCGGGECPTVYRTDRGTLVVQGYSFEPGHAGVAVPAGEQMVEIPAELLTDYLRSLS